MMKRGSALLIVLGMLSFMVISAVSFAIYMRQSRAPSSYLRRNISSRYLVKAALAKAIDQLEGDFDENENRFFGIFDDPYPGCGPDAKNQVCENGNYWSNRVFMAFGPTNSADTVATLTLEGLAYLPPAIVNDVRAAAPYAKTAVWRSLPYEAGRYAYIAVNVSDAIDINRQANTLAFHRDSSPSGRVSAATLFLNNLDNPSIDGIDNTSVENLFTKLEKLDPTEPLVSMADYSLVVGSDYAPFVRYIGTQGQAFTSKDDQLKMGSGLFITDTYFPDSPGDSKTNYIYRLGEETGQPFSKTMLEMTSYSDFTKGPGSESPAGSIKQDLEQNLGVGMICLKDYLDRDNIPTSFALPTTEAVPMIVGIGSPNALKPECQTEDPIDADNNGVEVEINGVKVTITRTIERTVLKSLGNRVEITAVAAYPFKHMKTTERTKDFTCRAVLKLFLVPDGYDDRCRLGKLNFGLTKDAWKKAAGDFTFDAGIATIVSKETKVSGVNNDILKAEDIAKDLKFTFDLEDINMPLFCKITQSYAAVNNNGNTPTTVPDPQTKYTLAGLKDDENRCLRPLLLEGGELSLNKDETWLKDSCQMKDLKTIDTSGNPVEKFQNSIPDLPTSTKGTLYAAVWIQVLDGANVVDMVPAYCEDDAEWLEYDGSGQEDGKLGSVQPMMFFRSDKAFSFGADLETVLGNDDVAKYPQWGALYAVDPRFNFAPEDWFSVQDKETATAADWKSYLVIPGDNNKKLFATDGRDPDPFMFVSDQERLQSIGELQFLPAIQRMNLESKVEIMGGDYEPTFGGKTFADRRVSNEVDQSLLNKCSNGGYFWRTYTAYEIPSGDGVDAIFGSLRRHPGSDLKLRFTIADTGQKINPYSEDIRVFYAALLNTPIDYYMASPIRPQDQNLKLMADLELKEGEKYVFGPNSSCGAKLDASAIANIADRFIESFADGAKNGKDWRDVYQDLLWEDFDNKNMDEKKTLLGELASGLHSVDRKFLYSFWHDCFANRQQLFLIFVRAEPAAVGGGGSGHSMTSQLGGRAVALVWRDPECPSSVKGPRTRPTNSNVYREYRQKDAPHRTRILFYHQFD